MDYSLILDIPENNMISVDNVRNNAKSNKETKITKENVSH